ncbi:MAG TPA: patatin-like phospholipase family protein [Acidimicrobiales bacterium]|nr:patatin-like phospholipase family protein [Acidimicrobiales bacterium]
MLNAALDVFRMRQYFNAVTRFRQLADAVSDDASFLLDARRALLPTPWDRPRPAATAPFASAPPGRRLPGLAGSRVAIAATGGSGALASVVGVARSFEDHGLRPSAISLCSGSSLFGFPIAAGMPASEVADFVLSLRPEDYVDTDWRRLGLLLPTAGRGFAGVVRGEAIERSYRRLVGDMTLGDMPVPAYAPIWNVERNRLQFIGPKTQPEMPVARAVRMAIALPLFIAPVPMDGGWWCDGGLVDIFPVRPLLDIEPPSDVVIAVNGFYPPGFAGEDAGGWHERPASILYAAAQVRTCQQVELARQNLQRLEAASDVFMIEPVPYSVVQGMGFYRQFFDNRQWAEFMTAGREAADRALAAAAERPAGRRAHKGPRPETSTAAASSAPKRVVGAG